MVPSRMGRSSTLVSVIKGLLHPQACPEATCPPGDSRLCQVYRTAATILAVIWTRVRLSQENWGSHSRCLSRPRVFENFGVFKKLDVVHICNLSSQEVKYEDYPWVQSQFGGLWAWSIECQTRQGYIHSKVLSQQQERWSDVRSWWEAHYIDLVDVFITYPACPKEGAEGDPCISIFINNLIRSKRRGRAT